MSPLLTVTLREHGSTGAQQTAASLQKIGGFGASEFDWQALALAGNTTLRPFGKDVGVTGLEEEELEETPSVMPIGTKEAAAEKTADEVLSLEDALDEPLVPFSKAKPAPMYLDVNGVEVHVEKLFKDIFDGKSEAYSADRMRRVMN